MAVCIRLCRLAKLGRVLLGFALLLSTQQGFNFRRDFPLVHGQAPLLVHFQLLSKSADGSLPARDQLLQVLVPQLLPRPAFSRALPAPLKLGFQIYLGWFATPFARFLHFASSHLEKKQLISLWPTEQRKFPRITGINLVIMA